MTRPEKCKGNFIVQGELFFMQVVVSLLIRSFIQLAIPKLMSGLGTSVKKCPN